MSNSRPAAHPRDWRRHPAELERHPLGFDAGAPPIDVQHACPECPLDAPRPFCQVCYGAGLVDGDRLERHAQLLNGEAEPGAIRVPGPSRLIVVESM